MTRNYDDAVFVYPNLVRWEDPAGDYLKNRPKYFAFEAVERSVALKDVGYNDVNFRRVDSIDTPDLSDIKLESLARVRISQAFWETFPPGTPETYTASVVSGNYIDNCFVEWTNEQDPAPDYSSEYSFSSLSISGNEEKRSSPSVYISQSPSLTAGEKTAIKAVADGTVIFSEWTAETGYVIILDHGNDLLSVYKHNASLTKDQGDLVKAGEVIATAGSTGKF